jgi:hypothetical protein
MRRSMTIRCAILVVLAAGMAFGADVTGKWIGEMSGPDGNGTSITFNFKQDGAKLTGTAQGQQGDPLEIKEGKVEGDKISFTVSFEGGNGEMKITHEGTIKSDDEIALNYKMPSPDGGSGGGTMTLKRSK